MRPAIHQWALAVRKASDDLEAELRKHLSQGVTLERLPTGQVRIRGAALEWVGSIDNAPAELGNVLVAAGASVAAADAVRALKRRKIPRPPLSE